MSDYYNKFLWSVANANGESVMSNTFFTHPDISLTTVQEANVITFINSVHNAGLINKNVPSLSKLIAIYLIIGGTAAAHAINLINPALHKVAWFGGLTHSANGVLGNQSNGYGDTGISPSALLSQNDTSLGCYSRTLDAAASVEIDMGSFGGGRCLLSLRFTGDIGLYNVNSNAAGTLTAAATTKYHVGSRTASTGTTGYRDAVSLGSDSLTSSALIAHNIYLLAMNNAGTDTQNSGREYAFFHVGPGMSSLEVTNMTNAVNVLQTSEGRNV